MPFGHSRKLTTVRFEDIEVGDFVEHLGMRLEVERIDQSGGFIVLKGDGTTLSGSRREAIVRVISPAD